MLPFQQFHTTLTRSFKVCSDVLTAEPTPFVGANGAGGGGPHVLGVDYLDGDGVARERDEALEVDVARLCVVQDDLPHVLLGAAGVLVVLPVGKRTLHLGLETVRLRGYFLCDCGEV